MSPSQGWLAGVLFDHESRAGRIFDLLIQVLILISMMAFCLETIDSVNQRFGRALFALELLIIVVFTAEYALRLYAAPRKLEFIFSFYGLVDLLAISPYVLIPVVDLRTIRIVRVFRIFRVLKLMRYHHVLNRFQRVIAASRGEFAVFFLAAALMIFVASVGIYQFEHEAQPEAFATVFHAMWWAVITLTTVGYGDVVPITAAGKCFTMLLLVTGLAIVAVPSGILASALTADARRNANLHPEPGPAVDDREPRAGIRIDGAHAPIGQGHRGVHARTQRKARPRLAPAMDSDSA